ncbi:Hypothetical predicted protein [Pelobates cultripes]|uniref:Uncharacterized protein n=1 Tax=Pelobates cultripes TaxID=61616 RepID=A0AAD1T302_PELCU|nr:Hypothetical predicted protein [Pelobates cultripes]
MAETPRRSTSASEEEDPEPEEIQPHTQSGRVVPLRQSDPQVATKIDITAMVIEAYITSEMAVLKTDLSTLAGKIQSTEDNVRGFGVKEDFTTAQLQGVTLTCAELTAKVGQMEDAATQRKLKIRGIPNAIDAGELPQFIMRLLSNTLTPKQAKDLSKSTLQWCATLKKVTSQLLTADIQYSWGTPRGLVVERNGKRHRITPVSNADEFFHSLGLPTTTTARRTDQHTNGMSTT